MGFFNCPRFTFEKGEKSRERNRELRASLDSDQEKMVLKYILPFVYENAKNRRVRELQTVFA